MTVPVLRQTTPVVAVAATGAPQTLVFPSGILLNSTIVFCGFVGRPGAASIADVTASVTATGVPFQRRTERSLALGPDFGCTVWTGSLVTTAGATNVVWTPGVASGNYVSLVAFELTGVSTAVSTFETAVSAAQNNVNSLTLGPIPQSGSMTQADTMLIYVSGANQGGGTTTNIGWATPVGYTLIAQAGDPSSAKKVFTVGYKTKTSTTPEGTWVTSSQADINGRSGILFAIRGNVAQAPAPAPPPPGPAPAPPPPAPAQAVKIIGAQDEVAGLTGILVQIHRSPTDEAILGQHLFSNETAAFEAALENGNAVMYVPVPIGVVLTTGDGVVVVGQKADGTGGFRGGVAGVVVNV